jgi:hypothetical protein
VFNQDNMKTSDLFDSIVKERKDANKGWLI